MLRRIIIEASRFDEYALTSGAISGSIYGASKNHFHLNGCACSGCQGRDEDSNKDQPSDDGLLTSFDSIPGDITTTEVLEPGSYIRSTIDTGDDSDWFAIQLVAGETYTFSTYLASGGLRDSTLTLRDENGVQLVFNDDVRSGLLWSEIVFTATTTGTYYLDVGSYATNTGTYFVSSSRPTNDDVADGLDTTGTIALGQTIDSELEQTGDGDWYAITLEAGQVIQFTTLNTGGSDADTTLSIRNSSGDLLAWNDDSSGTYSQVRFQVQESGVYYVDVGGWAESSAGAYRLTAEEFVLEEYTYDQIADQLTNGYWGGSARRWDVEPGGSLTVNITGLTAEGQFLAREALNLWSDILGISFVEVSENAQITFDDEDDGAYASSSVSNGFITNSNINVGTSWLDNQGTTLNSYSFQTYIHEIGHALGLGHGGNYNGQADYIQEALYLNDSWSTTIMSYFDQNENTFFRDQGFTRQFVLTPMNGDVVAIQNSYGLSTTTRTEDNIYGFGNNTGRAVYGVGAEVTNSSGQLLTFAIFDNGGEDTLNYSPFQSDQVINLNQETFSSVGGRIGNMTIARGTVIENAVSGSGNDQLIGNESDNLLTGGLGNDSIDGGLGNDTAVFSGDRSEYTIIETSQGTFQIEGPDGTDILTNIEFVQFDDQLLALNGFEVDADGDGFVDGLSYYRIYKDEGGVDLQFADGRVLSDDTSPAWDATRAVATISGFDILLTGAGVKAGEFYIYSTGADGVITGGSGWRTGAQMYALGFEDIFNIDFNGDGTVGYVDNDGNGLVDGLAYYRLYTDGGGVNLQRSNGGLLSDNSSSVWDATNAVQTDTGFEVLLTGTSSKDGQFYVYTTDATGVINGGSGWQTGAQMYALGFEDIFNIDFNGDGTVGYVDNDGNGLVDGLAYYRLYTENATVALQRSNGGRLSDESSSVWDATNAVQTDTGGFQVLLTGANARDGQFYVYTTDATGVINGGSGWQTGAQMYALGFEDIFNIDFNGDGTVGYVDNDGNGLVDGLAYYRLYTENATVALQRSNGGRLSDESSSVWDATNAVQTDTGGFQVLLTGANARDGQFYVYDVDPAGTIVGGSGWKTGEQMYDFGYESIFNIDFNGDGTIGFIDSNNDGFVDNSVNYRIITADRGAVDLQRADGRTLSDASSPEWDATKAVAKPAEGYQVLLTGENARDGTFYVYEVDAEGVIVGGSGWLTGEEMFNQGYESIFGVDFNGDGVIEQNSTDFLLENLFSAEEDETRDKEEFMIDISSSIAVVDHILDEFEVSVVHENAFAPSDDLLFGAVVILKPEFQAEFYG